MRTICSRTALLRGYCFSRFSVDGVHNVSAGTCFEIQEPEVALEFVVYILNPRVELTAELRAQLNVRAELIVHRYGRNFQPALPSLRGVAEVLNVLVYLRERATGILLSAKLRG